MHAHIQICICIVIGEFIKIYKGFRMGLWLWQQFETVVYGGEE